MADLRVEDATTGPSMSESRRATYREAHSALSWPLLSCGLSARYYNNFKNGYFSRLIPPRLSPTWVVPTRHPEALSQALQAVPGHQGPVRPRYEGRSCS